MHSSHLSKSNLITPDNPETRRRTPPYIRLITDLCRILVGATFIFSGFVKTIDPWGTVYKMEEYMAAFSFDPGHNIIVAGVFLLCCYEFIVGVSILTGSYRKSAPWLAMIMMAVMLPLTLWIWIANPVSDCGCFGDAVILSNAATFWKNVVLVILIFWLIRFNTSVRCLISPVIQWLQVVASGAFVLTIGFYGFSIQPMLDFRPYKVGTTLLDSEDESNEADEMTFVYERNGERREFKETDELPDEESGWKFVERIESASATTKKSTPEKSLRLWSMDGKDDVTDYAIDNEGDMILLLMPDLGSVSTSQTWRINSMHDWAEQNDMDMIAVTAASPAQIAEWSDLSLPTYPIYTADDTAIKEVARGNPSVVLLRNGVIEWKYTLMSLPADDFLDPETDINPMTFKRDGRRTLYNVSALYVAVIAVLILLSLVPSIGRMFRSQYERQAERLRRQSSRLRKLVTRGDKAHPEE